MRKVLIAVLLVFLFFGCSKDKLTLEKDDYLIFKEQLLEQESFEVTEDLSFDLNVYIDRISDEEISYRAIIDKPKENMRNIKAIVVHNYFTDEIFPSIGIFDEPVTLNVFDEDVKGITLVGYIKTTKEIKELNLEIRVYIEYTDDFNEVKKIYYKSTI